jgi:hypothetical protein
MSTVRAPTTKRIKLSGSSNRILMTPEEFDAVVDCDDQFVYELIHRVLIASPPAGEGERGTK